MILLVMLGYSQNRYSKTSVATYSPMLVSPEIYKAIAEQKIENISSNINYYESLTIEALNSNIDDEFRQDIYEIRGYLNTLKNGGTMDISLAESYIKTINRKYNKAVRKYNTRVKKSNK